MCVKLALFLWLLAEGLSKPLAKKNKIVKLREDHKDYNSPKTEKLLNKLGNYEMVIPVLVDEQGRFLSYSITQNEGRTRPKRDTERIFPETIFYKLSAFGNDFHFELQTNKNLMSDFYVAELWGKNGRRNKLYKKKNCHYIGYSKEPTISTAAISNCFGLHGVFQTDKDDYFVEPMWNNTNEDKSRGHPHLVYKRSALKLPNDNAHCDVTDQKVHLMRSFRRSSFFLGSVAQMFEGGVQRTISQSDLMRDSFYKKGITTRQRRSAISEEKNVETFVVADRKMVKYHGRKVIESYILSIMNVVAKLFHDASIGNAINIVVTRLAILEKNQKNLTLNHNADRSLDSFCKWQSRQFGKGNQSTLQHDNAVLITGYDICTYKNSPCGTLGLAPVGGMCSNDRSCSINEDIGLASAFTIAHEIGHNFGMQHDGSGNLCGTPGSTDPAGIMAAQLTKDTRPFNWSSCSRKYITDFLDSMKSNCLNNKPAEKDIVKPRKRSFPEEQHDANKQCKQQFGEASKICKPREVCRELWCINKEGKCRTNSIPAAEGTDCYHTATGKNGWCYLGECRPPNYKPEPVDGHWGQWSLWETCTRSCGGGVESSFRRCSDPEPRHGGKYCVGQRKRYRSCNIKPCPENEQDFRELQCADFNTKPFRGRYYNWKPFTGSHDKPCALNCIADGFNFYTERARKVIDGTKCFPDQMDMCVNGKCLPVGCDGILGSNTIEDMCRVCNGDNSTCYTISGTFDKHLTSGAYYEIVKIPKRAMHIHVQETNKSQNYLALKNDQGNFYINGKWTIDWPRKFSVAGTFFHYERKDNELEILRALGPIQEDLIIMVLLQAENEGIMYQYNMPKDPGLKTNNVSLFTWKHTSWSDCSKTCGKGKKLSKAVCVMKVDNSVVEDSRCNPQPKPSNHIQNCNDEVCPPVWSIGDWSSCSVTCGRGRKMRTVICVQTISDTEKIILQDHECFVKKPRTTKFCTQHDCPSAWFTEEWSKCPDDCGTNIQSRDVFCMTSDKQKYLLEKKCNRSEKPPNKQACFIKPCPGPQWKTGKWGPCSSKCGKGRQTRTVTCRNHRGGLSNKCSYRNKPSSIKECQSFCESKQTPELECYDQDRAQFCPLVVKHRVCNRKYFFRMCCRSCMDAGQVPFIA